MALVPLPDVQELVLAECTVAEPVSMPLAAALHHVLAAAAVCSEDVPGFANSAMDGYALRAADTAGATARLAVVGTLAAGSMPAETVGPGQAMRIMTGAPTPAGADAVVIVEQTEQSDDGTSVLVLHEASRGDHIRAPGSDLRAGTRVCEAGDVVGPGHVGVLATIGVTEVAVHPRPRVGVFSTGDELVPASSKPAAGQIRDSNRPALLACVEHDRFEAVDLGRLPDREDEVRRGIEAALDTCDAIVTSGGVSAGDFDYVKRVLAALARESGGSTHTLGVAIRPAKPFSFAVVCRPAGSPATRRVPVFGLPGNPVSSLVSYELFARPALRKMAGHRDPLRTPVRGVAGEDLPRRPDGKLHLDRVVARPRGDGRLVARSAGERPQASHQLGAMAIANALALVPDGEGIAAGEELDLLVLDWS